MTGTEREERLLQVLSIILELINDMCGLKQKFYLAYAREDPKEKAVDV